MPTSYSENFDTLTGVSLPSGTLFVGNTPVMRPAVPGNATGAGFVVQAPVGVVFASGISVRITTGAADNDTGAATAGDVLVNCQYK